MKANTHTYTHKSINKKVPKKYDLEERKFKMMKNHENS